MKKLILSFLMICLFAGFGFAQLKVEAAGVKVGAETTPVEALDVEGAVKLGTTANANAGTLRWTGTDFEGYDGANWLKFAGAGSSMWSSNAGKAYFNGGNVGVGTDNPSELFHISRSGGAATMRLERSDFNNFSTLTSGTVGNAFAFSYDKSFLFTPVNPSATNIALVDYAISLFGPNWSDGTVAGNVGIGTFSPTQKLHVIGNVLANGYMTITPFTDGAPIGQSRKRYGIKEVVRLKAKEFSGRNGEKVINFSPNDLKRIVPDLTEEYLIKSYEFIDNDAEMPSPDKVQKGLMIKESEIKYLLINAIQDQQELINEQEKQISSLVERLEKLEKSMPKIGKVGKSNNGSQTNPVKN